MNLSKLKRGNKIIINDDEYEVIDNTSSWYYVEKKELEMRIDLVKTNEFTLLPKYVIRYDEKKPERIMSFTNRDKNIEIINFEVLV